MLDKYTGLKTTWIRIGQAATGICDKEMTHGVGWQMTVDSGP
jgi:hypothetical protein